MIKYLDRESAPIDTQVWKFIDQTVVESARRHLVGRRFIDIDGPYGLGLKTVDEGAEIVLAGSEGEPNLVYSRGTPLPAISHQFKLSLRNMEAFQQFRQLLNLAPVAEAARACAQLEDQLIFYGRGEIGLPGLITVQGSHQVSVSDWRQPNRAFDDITRAIERLDQYNYSGPYALVLMPALYHQLFQPYEDSNLMPIKQMNQLVTGGIFKSPILKEAGVLVSIGRDLLRLVLGQDLVAGFQGIEGLYLSFNLSESLLLQISVPEAICVLAHESEEGHK
ncbi:MAG: bacteriocin family protein [Acidobacteria bacterium]|nr:bacteriocin family protein [Acidobacteriota bacterium]